MQQPQTDLPIRVAKRIRQECLHCKEPALDGSDYCGPHDARERGQAATRQRRHRQKLADSGRCIAGCGKKVPKKRREDGTVIGRRCAGCRKEHRETARAARACVTQEVRGVTSDHAQRIAARTELVVDATDGYARKRFKGGKKGAPSSEERCRRDLADIRRGLAVYEERLAEAYALDVAALPRDQQRSKRDEAYAILSYAVRLGMEALVSYGYEAPVLHTDEIGDSDDESDT